MFSRVILLAQVLFMVHCSAEQNDPMTQVQSRRALDTELKKTSEVATPIERPSSDPQPSPAQANPPPKIPEEVPVQDPPPAPTPPQPSPAPQAPVKPAEGSQPAEKNNTEQSAALPDVVLDSDKALIPLPSLAGVGAGPVDRDNIQGIFKFLSSLMPDGAPGYLSCTSTMKFKTGYYSLHHLACRQVSDSGDSVAVRTASYSWKFTLTNCPGLTFEGNLEGQACSRRSLSFCAPVVPATRIELNGIDLDTCLARGSQLIYSVVDKRTGKTTDQILDLVKNSTP